MGSLAHPSRTFGRIRIHESIDARSGPADETAGLLSFTPYLGCYIWDEDNSPLKVFLIPDEVQSAGRGPDVTPLDQNGDAFTVKKVRWLCPLLAGLQAVVARLAPAEI